MLASPADHGRRSAQEKSLLASTVRISKSIVSMQTGKETGPKSSTQKQPHGFDTDFYRAFGSLAEKVADYEALLRDLSSRVCEEDATVIKTLLDKVCTRYYSLHSFAFNLTKGCRLGLWRFAGYC